MENWTMREWSAKELRAYYQECLRRDFPPDERMPLARMEELTQTGGQVSLGFYRAGELAEVSPGHLVLQGGGGV